MKIELNEKQLETLSEMCDIMSRLYSGQVKELNRLSHDKIPELLLLLLKTIMFPDLAPNSSYGISSDKIDEKAKTLYDTHQVIRHYIAWKNENNTSKNRDWNKQLGTQYDDPIRFSIHPLIKIID